MVSYIKKRGVRFLKRRKLVRRKRRMARKFTPSRKRRMFSRAAKFNSVGRNLVTQHRVLPDRIVAYHNYDVSSAPNTLLGDYWLGIGSTGGSAGFYFRTNSVYDPCANTLTHFDQVPSMYGFYSRFYSRYAVKWSKISIEISELSCTNTSGTTVAADVGFGIRLDDDGSAVVDPYEKTRFDRRWHQTIMRVGGLGNRGVARLTHFWSEKMMAPEDRAFNAAAPGYNPGEAKATYFFVPCICDASYSALDTVTLKCRFTVRMTMKVVWSDLKDVDNDSLIAPG